MFNIGEFNIRFIVLRVSRLAVSLMYPVGKRCELAISWLVILADVSQVYVQKDLTVFPWSSKPFRMAMFSSAEMFARVDEVASSKVSFLNASKCASNICFCNLVILLLIVFSLKLISLPQLNPYLSVYYSVSISIIVKSICFFTR